MHLNILGLVGFALILVGVILPFAHLQQNPDDMLPMLVGLVTFVIGVVVLFRAMSLSTARNKRH